MWRNPNYPAPEPASPPRETGERLLTVPRKAGEELRVILDSYNGSPYVSVRLWTQGSDGGFWPTKKGCSIRISEIEDVARALMLAKDLVEGPPEPRARSLPGPSRAGSTGASRGLPGGRDNSAG